MTDMRIYVGRWDLLPKEWEGFNGLAEKDEEEIKAELSREIGMDRGYHDNFLAIYTRAEFEDTFNGDLLGDFNNEKYWIRIF